MYNEKMRANLIELLSREIFPREGVDPAVVVADYLLDNGVIVPPCKVGDVLYEIDYDFLREEDEIVESNVISFGFFTQNGIYRFDDYGKNPYLSYEDAEKALKGVE